MTVTHHSGGYPIEVPPEQDRATTANVENAKILVSMMWRFVQVR